MWTLRSVISRRSREPAPRPGDNRRDLVPKPVGVSYDDIDVELRDRSAPGTLEMLGGQDVDRLILRGDALRPGEPERASPHSSGERRRPGE